MKHRFIFSILFLSILVLVPLSASCIFIGEPDDTIDQERPAKCTISNLSIEPGAIMVGNVTKIEATISSIDDETGVYTAIFLIEGDEIYREDIIIRPGESKKVMFQLTGESTGSYRISIGKSSKVLTVYEWSKYELKYDGGDAYGTDFLTGETGHIIHFMPESRPFVIKKVKIYCDTVVESPRELDSRFVVLRIWNKDKSQLTWTQEYPWRDLEGGAAWKELEVPDLAVNDDFHVELVTDSEYIQKTDQDEITNYVAIGWDRPSPKAESTGPFAQTRSGLSEMGTLITTPSVMYEGIRWFIRIEGECAPLVLAYDDGGDEEWHWTNANYSVLFSPPTLPFIIRNIAIYGYADTKDLTDYSSKKMTVRVKEEASGEVLWQGDFNWDLFDLDNAKWVKISTPDIECWRAFYVDVITDSTDEDSCIKLGIDYGDRNRHSFISSDVLLRPGFSGQVEGSKYDSDTANWMIRAEGVYIIQTF